ncbi:DNA alkylation repair protein [Fundicoccus culcitae]|uniref:DNA alkylation repair protein n=1 Tax=Fundicoccus culcitae TaxID=2969821 RepID=A0ABY5P797_9LACT|nr:DNA alkylation repair protein [Fundicoccus culcitae]UUX34245.1 DNA alkylation repair protein [Fundicoccus culcitae]
MLNEIFDILPRAANQDNKMAMEKYMRNQFEFLGIKTPERRHITQPFFKEAKQTAKSTVVKADVIKWKFVDNCWKRSEREYQMVAIDYLNSLKEYLSIEDLNKLLTLITTKSWWDSVDSLAKIVGSIFINKEANHDIMLDWSTNDNLWIRRTAILHQLGYKERTQTDVLAVILTNNFGSNEFFINKAIGWALRDYAKSNPTWVMSFLESNQKQMSTLSWREATKHLN